MTSIHGNAAEQGIELHCGIPVPNRLAELQNVFVSKLATLVKLVETHHRQFGLPTTTCLQDANTPVCHVLAPVTADKTGLKHIQLWL
jgi:hypothetical protein